MSDWDYFCREIAGIDPNDPQQFDDWLSEADAAQPRTEQHPPRLALPTRELLAGLADSECGRCAGTGYLGRYRWNCEGRCFACLPDVRWHVLLQELEEASSLARVRLGDALP